MLITRRQLLRQALLIADTASLAAGFITAYFIVEFGLGRKFTLIANYTWLLALILPIWLASFHLLGLYNSVAYTTRWGLAGRLVRAQFVAALLLFSAMYITHSIGVSRLFLQIFLAVSFLCFAGQKFALRAYLDNARRRNRIQRRKILLVSEASRAERNLALIHTHASMISDVVGLLMPGTSKNYPRLATISGVFGTIEDLPAVLQTRVVDEVIVGSTLEPALLERLSRWCAVRGTSMRLLIELPNPAIGLWHAEYISDGAFLLSLVSIPQNALSLLMKRVIDICGAAIGLVICGIAYVVYGRRLRCESGDSVLFQQCRVGENGRRFTLYKFRTMHAGADQVQHQLVGQNAMNGPIFKLEKDPRVTPTGRKLRRRHLDELPQFWNVLKGEMSLVGTRPPTGDEVGAYDEHHHRRLSMKPGITGLWQLNGNGKVHDFEEIVNLDCQYIDNWSLWLDFKILGRTVTKVVRGDAW